MEFTLVERSPDYKLIGISVPGMTWKTRGSGMVSQRVFNEVRFPGVCRVFMKIYLYWSAFDD